MSAALEFSTQLVRRNATAANWREAVTDAGALLVRAGCASAGFPKRLVGVLERYGPYLVIAPGVALVHAQPRPDALKDGLAAVTFHDGVTFGHSQFDPVRLVLAIATTSAATHLDAIASIASALEHDGGLVERALAAESDAALAETLREALPLA